MAEVVEMTDDRIYPAIDPAKHSLPPVIVFHGNDNALSIVRSLGRRSLPIYVLNEPESDVRLSRYARPLPIRTDTAFKTAAIDFLLGPDSDPYAGSVLLAASDEALEAIAENRDALERKFRLDLSNPIAQQNMLDKLATYRIAQDAHVPTPKFWQVDSLADVEQVREELVYPLIVKPILSHLFQRKFNAKFIVAEDFDSLRRAFQQVAEVDLRAFLLEKIPGPDSLLCSYYTYLDEQGTPLFDFTKRIIRRYPMNMGLATYHVTDHVDGIKDPALRLFEQAGLRGLANAEFKYDERDQTYKLIECNARFTAANGLLAKAGIDLSSMVYNRLVGLPLPPLDRYRDNVTLWDPMRDLKAYRELREKGQLSFPRWLRGVLRPQVFPCFDWADPRPAAARLRRRMGKGGSR